MKKLTFSSVMAFAIVAMVSSLASADIYVGSYQVDDGPNWTTVPDVYTAQQAAALVFGGLASDYRISTDASLDPNTITDTGWYSIIGIPDGTEFAHNFSQDLGGPGYAAAGWENFDDISAWVDDNAIGPQYTNYVWRVAAVPEPGSMALLGLGAIGLGLIRRRRE